MNDETVVSSLFVLLFIGVVSMFIRFNDLFKSATETIQINTEISRFNDFVSLRQTANRPPAFPPSLHLDIFSPLLPILFVQTKPPADAHKNKRNKRQPPVSTIKETKASRSGSRRH